MSVHFARALPPLLFLLCAVVLLRDAIADGRIYYQDDTINYYLPLAARVAESLRDGRLPLWTPYIFGGHPLLADSESAILYPPNLLAWLLLPFDRAIVLQRLLRYLLGALFTYLFGRAVGLSRVGATLAGLSFGFGSFMVGQLHHKNLADAAIWLPLVLCLVERALQAEAAARWRWALLAGAALGTQLLTIHVNPVLMTGLMLGAYVLARVTFVGEPRPGPRAAAGVLAAVGLVAAGVAAIQLVPLYELSTFSFRGRQVEWEFATSFAPPPQNLLTLLFPYFFREPATNGYWSPWFRWNTTVYAGVVPLLLAGAAVALAKPRRWVLFFGGTSVVALLLALGDRAPINLYAVIWQLPIFSSTRVPGRYLFLALFALAMLAGFGLDALRRLADDEHRRFARLVLPLTTAAAALAGSFAAMRGWAERDPGAVYDRLLAPYLAIRGRNLDPSGVADPFAALLVSLDPASRWTSRTFAILAAALLLLWLCALRRQLVPLCLAGLVVLTAGDLLVFGRDFHPNLPIEGVIGPGPAARFLAEHPGLHRVLTLSPVWETVPNRLLPLRVFEANGYSSLIPDRHRAYMRVADRWQAQDGRLLDLLGVRYVVLRPESTAVPVELGPPVFRSQEVAVHERTTALPRAFVVGETRLAATPADALDEMVRYDFDPRRRLILEEPAAIAWGAGGGGRAEIASYKPERVVVRVAADGPAFLLLADTYYPGWHATVDGAARPIYRADHLFRAVPIGPGDRTVEMTYEPPSVSIGAAISALTLAALGVGLLATAGVRLRRVAAPTAGRRAAPSGAGG